MQVLRDVRDAEEGRDRQRPANRGPSVSAGDPPPPGARDPVWTEATASDTSLTNGSSGLGQRVILVVQKITRTPNTPGRRQGGRRQGEEEEEVERVHGRQVGHEVLFKRGEDHVDKA